jgi:hypothetical protein
VLKDGTGDLHHSVLFLVNAGRKQYVPRVLAELGRRDRLGLGLHRLRKHRHVELKTFE